MSVVTNILLIHGLAESDDDDETFAALAPIQEYLQSEHRSQLNHLNGAEGGSKNFEVEIWGGAFNHLQLIRLMEVVRDAPWVDPLYVQLMVMTQEDIGFTVFQLHPANWGAYWDRETRIDIPGRTLIDS